MLINWLMLDAYNNDHTKIFVDYIIKNLQFFTKKV